jgi:ribonuclease PH
MVVDQQKSCSAQLQTPSQDAADPDIDVTFASDRDQILGHKTQIAINEDRVKLLVRLAPEFCDEIGMEFR